MGKDELLRLAAIAFDAIEKNTGSRYWTPGDGLKAAFDQFRLLNAGHGASWLIDSTAGTGLSHLGLAYWTQGAREILDAQSTTSTIAELRAEIETLRTKLTRQGSKPRAERCACGQLPLSERSAGRGHTKERCPNYPQTEPDPVKSSDDDPNDRHDQPWTPWNPYK